MVKLPRKTTFRKLGKRIRKPFHTLYSKSPILALAVLIILSVLILGGGSYGVYRATTQTPDTDTTSEAAPIDSVDEPSEDLSDKPKHNSTKENTSNADDVESDGPKAPGPKTGAGCVMSGCPGNPTFSVNLSRRSVTVVAGEMRGVLITASTSDGRKVDWASPTSDGYGPGAHSMNSSDFENKSSIDYYVTANKNVKPGTYTLTFPASDMNERTRLETSFKVTVLPFEEFSIKLRNGYEYQGADLQLRFSVIFTEGAGMSVHIDSTLNCPGEAPRNGSGNISGSSSWDAYIYYHDFAQPTTPKACTVSVDASKPDGTSRFVKSFSITLK